mgnify:CR=1 FL=1
MLSAKFSEAGLGLLDRDHDGTISEEELVESLYCRHAYTVDEDVIADAEEVELIVVDYF